MAAELDPEVATNYQLLVDCGDRTWADIATMAEQHASPDLAEYARARAAEGKRATAPATTPTSTPVAAPRSDVGDGR